MKKLSFVGSAFALTLLTSTIANSAIVLIDAGDTVDFYYDDTDPGTLAYGALQVSGDTIFATPTTFEASALNGEGTNIFTNTGSVIVVAHEGYRFSGVSIQEGGTYNTTGNGSVDVVSSVKVVDTDFFLRNATNFLDISDLSVTGANTWSGEGGHYLGTSMWDSTTSIEVILTNWLYATSPDGDSTALINKTLAGSSIGMSISTVVPIPAAVWLFGSGLIGLIGVARRKKV